MVILRNYQTQIFKTKFLIQIQRLSKLNTSDLSLVTIADVDAFKDLDIDPNIDDSQNKSNNEILGRKQIKPNVAAINQKAPDEDVVYQLKKLLKKSRLKKNKPWMCCAKLNFILRKILIFKVKIKFKI